MPHNPTPHPQERWILWVLAGIQFSHIVDFMIMMPLGPQITQQFGIGDAAFGFLVSSYTWAAAISGLMASAFTDQLRIDRETFENEFRDALAKGQISQNDRHALNAEAERLHLTEQDVNRIMEKVRHELKFQVQGLTAHLNPEQLLEKYRQQVSQLRSLVQSDDFQEAEALVQDIMTAKVITVESAHTIDHCMQVMTEHHIRHLPIMEKQQVKGLISIGDVVKEMLAHQKATIEQLHSYIAG